MDVDRAAAMRRGPPPVTADLPASCVRVSNELPLGIGLNGQYGNVPANEPWFSVRCVFRREDTFEERITLWRATDFEEAITLAEADARDYAQTLEAEYLGLAQAFHLSESDLDSAVEVFSLIRQSDLDPEEYLSAFFDTGTELQRSLQEEA